MRVIELEEYECACVCASTHGKEINLKRNMSNGEKNCIIPTFLNEM